MWQLYEENGVMYNFVYFLSWSLVFYLGLTIFSVPYLALGYEISDDFHERTQIMAISQFIGQWAWVIAPWFWVILYDPKWFPEGAAQGVRDLSVWVAIPCSLFAIIPALFIKSKSTVDRTDFLPINARYIGKAFQIFSSLLLSRLESSHSDKLLALPFLSSIHSILLEHLPFSSLYIICSIVTQQAPEIGQLCTAQLVQYVPLFLLYPL